MLADQPPRPANMNHIVAVNQGRQPYSFELAAVPGLSAADAARRVAQGWPILDIRSHALHARSHPAGALNIALAGSTFEQSVGWILPGAEPLLLVVERSEQAADAARKLAFVGLDRRAAGWITERDWNDAGLPRADLPEIDVGTLRRRLAGSEVGLLDVRDADEWAGGCIARAERVNFRHLPSAIDRLPFASDRPLAVICATGPRSSTACGILRQHGFAEVYNVRGGMNAWHDAGFPVTVPSGS